jgi:hypothetical protein
LPLDEKDDKRKRQLRAIHAALRGARQGYRETRKPHKEKAKKRADVMRTKKIISSIRKLFEGIPAKQRRAIMQQVLEQGE